MDPSEWGVEIEAHLEYRRTTWVQLSHTEHIFQGPLLISLLAAIGLSQNTCPVCRVLSPVKRQVTQYKTDYKNRSGTHLLPLREKLRSIVAPSFPSLVWTKSSMHEGVLVVKEELVSISLKT